MYITLLSGLIVSAIAYCFGALTSLTWNFAEWHLAVRGIYCLVQMAILFALLQQLAEDANKVYTKRLMKSLSRSNDRFKA